MATWFADQRSAFIAEMLHIYGFINREHLIRKFGISMPQASMDLTAFQRSHPRVVAYNLNTKQYERLAK